MKLPAEFEDSYVKGVLYNTSLEDLTDEKWKLIEGLENYAISNYGRVKSLARKTQSFPGLEREQPELVMKLIFNKHFNKYLQRSFYNVFCSLTLENKRYRRSVARLVYYHFIEQFDMSDRSVVISYKDGNSLHVNYKNLEKISSQEKTFKTLQCNRAKNLEIEYRKPVSQYTVEGELIAHFQNIYAAGKAIGVTRRSILAAVKGQSLTAGGSRWFFKSSPPQKEDFIIDPKPKPPKKIFNIPLWKRLGKPVIDKNNPPACLNLSLDDLPGEKWKPIPGFENQYMISDKGRVKRLGSWTSNKKSFWKEQIMAIMAEVKYSDRYYFYIMPNLVGKKASIVITRFMYYCFVNEFDLNDKTLVVINRNDPLWDLDVTKLSLRSDHSIADEKNT